MAIRGLFTRVGSQRAARLRAALLPAAVVALLMAWSPRVQAQHFLFPAPAKSLEYGNASKIVVGPLNKLHAVFADASGIWYTTSSNGSWWLPPEMIASAPSGAKHPALAVDSAGHVGVVWVANPGPDGMGSLRYSRRPAGSLTWTTVALGINGAEPAMVGKASTMYLTWVTTGGLTQVQYTKFNTLSPPATLPIEMLQTMNCPNTGFRKPSITLVSALGVPPVPRIAYLYYSDEQASVPACSSSTTKIGPIVMERSYAGGYWFQIYSDIITSTLSTSTVEPVSLSLGAHFSSAHTFLAWSDKRNGVGRTRLAHLQSTALPAVVSLSSTLARHVHLRAANSAAAPPTEFRLAWSTPVGGADPFFGLASSWNSATWTGATPAWGTAQSLNTPGAVGRPQSVYWGRCAPVEQYAAIHAYFEAAAPNGARYVATDYGVTTPCPSVVVWPGLAVEHAVVPVATISIPGQLPPGTVVDVSELGAITRVGDTFATVVTPDSRTVTIAWSGGVVSERSDSTLTVTAPRAAVTITSPNVSFSLLEVGHLREYDTGRSPPAR